MTWQWSRWWVVVGMAVAVAASGCSDDSGDAAGEESADGAATDIGESGEEGDAAIEPGEGGDEDTSPDPEGGADCDPNPFCTEVGDFCDGDVHVTCVVSDDGCLNETTEDCSADGATCVSAEPGEASCVEEEPVSCLDVPCDEEGSQDCDGTVVRECALTSEDCGLEWTPLSDCADTEQACAAVDGEAACLDIVVCPASPCAEVGTFCDGDTLNTCEQDDTGCIVVASTEDCTDRVGGTCTEGPPAECSAPVQGEIIGEFSFELVVSLDTPNPSDFGAFTYFEQNPTLDALSEEPTVYFRGTANPPVSPPQSSPAQAVYVWTASEGVQLVTQTTSPIPGGVGGFSDFAELVINPPVGDGGLMAFVGNGMNSQRGIYSYDGAAVGLIADKNTPIPGGDGNFGGLGEPYVYDDEIVFLGTAVGQGGFYRWSAGELFKIVDLNDPIPNGTGTYTGIGFDDFRGTEGVFQINGTAPAGAPFEGGQRGLAIIGATGAPTEVIVDRQTPLPDAEDTFFIMAGGLFDGDGLFFHGRGSPGELGPFGSTQHKGLYRWEDGNIDKVVNTSDLIPGEDITFSFDFANGLTSQYMAVSGGDMLFRGVGTVGDQKPVIGLYLYRGEAGTLEPVLSIADTLDGKAMTDILISRRSYQGDHFVLWAKFADGTQGIYLGRPVE